MSNGLKAAGLKGVAIAWGVMTGIVGIIWLMSILPPSVLIVVFGALAVSSFTCLGWVFGRDYYRSKQ